MKLSKKTTLLISFCVGTLLLVTSAFAEISSKSGYEQFKDAVKLTAKGCSKELKSYTLEATMSLKNGDSVLFTSEVLEKSDILKGAKESTTNEQYASGENIKNYRYNDSSKIMWYNQDEDIYYVTEYTENKTREIFNNPFEEEHAKDIEKIFDAAVGNLKDYVVVQENSDGSKGFNGTISEAQIPTLINAVSSFMVKQQTANQYRNNRVNFPAIIDDIFIKKVSGRAKIDKDGIIESVFGSCEISGLDKDGKVHNLVAEVLIKIYDVNSTTVTVPNLEGKKVEKTIDTATKETTISNNFVGEYKNDIVINKNNVFIKVGERHLTISHINDKNVSGRYYEVYKPEYSEYSDSTDFSFDVKMDKGEYAEFEYKDSKGNKRQAFLSFDKNVGKIYLDIYNTNNTNRDNSFSRVFED